MSHDDFAGEYMRGIPAALPEGERLLWQGAPEWRALAVHAFHVRKVLVYFALLLIVRAVLGAQDGQGAAAIVAACAWIATLGLCAAGILCLLAWLTARATVYSITSGRLLMRFGIAVPLTINFPCALVQSANLKRFADGSAELSVRLDKRVRVGWFVTWPHVRPGHFMQPQPTLRGLRNADEPAAILAKVLEADEGHRPGSVPSTDSAGSAAGVTHRAPRHAQAF